MEIQFPINLAAPVVARLAASMRWSVNDILIAEVVGKDEENFTRLAIGDRIVVARTDVALTVGQKLNLQVTSSGDTTVMRVLPSASASALEIGTVSRALARVLPQQATPQDTERLLHIVAALSADTRALSDSVGRSAAATLTQDIRNLLQALPSSAQLGDAPQLRNAVEQAALPTEARVMAAVKDDDTPDITQDVRAQLARLANDLAALPASARHALDKLVLQTSDGHLPSHVEVSTPVADSNSLATVLPADPHHAVDLKSLVDSVVARLESNQLQNVVNPASSQLPLVIDLPVVRDGHTDLLHMEVEGDGRANDGEAAQRTSVTLNLKLDDGHEFSARLQLSGDALSVRMGSTDANFNDQIAARIGDLEQSLSQAGLELTQVFIAPLSVSARPRLGARQLINERV